MNDETTVWQVAHGLYFGYPLCCIKAFVTGVTKGNMTNRFSGTGFLECPACRKRHASRADMYRVINENRKCPVPFSDAMFPATSPEQELIDEIMGTWEDDYTIYNHVDYRHADAVTSALINHVHAAKET